MARKNRDFVGYPVLMGTLVMLLLAGLSPKLAAQPTFFFVQDSVYADSLYLQEMRISDHAMGFSESKTEAAATLMLRSQSAAIRAEAADTVLLVLQRALATPQGYAYPFSGLSSVSQLADSAGQWRLFTWQHYVDDSTYRYDGLLALASDSPRVFRLEDAAQALGMENDFELHPEQWYGALYYDMRPFMMQGGKQAWLLFGFDAQDQYIRRKVLDVLTFNRRGQPVFGKEVFVGSERDSALRRSRIILEYRADAGVNLRYDDDLGGVVHDRLVPGPPVKPGMPPTYIPDGSYDGFVYDAATGEWHYRQEYFDRVISTEAPRPAPIFGTSSENRDLFGRPRKPKATPPR